MLLDNQNQPNFGRRANRNNPVFTNEDLKMHSTGYAFTQNGGNFISLLIIDESGSMGNIRKAVVESYNDLVASILKDAEEIPDLLQHMNVYTFEGQNIVERLPLTTVSDNPVNQHLNYIPKGGTPLYDAIGMSITKLERLIIESNIPSNKFKVSVAIFTDGLENASRDFSLLDIQQMVNRLKSLGWEFNYYGTDHDVEDIATLLEMNRCERFEKTSYGLKNSMENYSNNAKISKSDFVKRFK
jgi:Mg-chelatase subunit ChlD